MEKFFSGIYARYRMRHEHTSLAWLGLVGLIAYPGFYLIRLTGQLPARHDDLYSRLLATLLCLLLAARAAWPKGIEPFYLPYSYFAAVYCLAVFPLYVLLQNAGAVNTVVNMVICAGLVILLTDWRNALTMLGAGYAVAITLYVAIHPDPVLPAEVLYWWFPLCAVLVAGGCVCRQAEQRAQDERGRLLTALAGSIAHEMRTPFMHVQHALDTVGSALPVRPGPNVTYTGDQIAEMAAMIAHGQDAIARGLQAITVTLGQLKPQAVDAGSPTYLSAEECARRALEEYAWETTAQRDLVSLHVTQDFVLKADETAIVLVLFNLLRNALHAARLRPGADVTVSITKGHANSIIVSDTGSGIAKDQMARLFSDFHTHGKSGGTGLGLAFCRRAMRAIGGDMTCTSEPGRATAFALRFPPVAEADIAKAQAATLRRAKELLSGKRVLVVDDSVFTAASTSAKLSFTQCDVDQAHDGPAALQALNNRRYDLVIMDINMDGMNGYETTRHIRDGAAPGSEGIPVLGHSSETGLVARAKARRAGMDAFRSKPCSESELAMVVITLLERGETWVAPPTNATNIPGING